MPYTLNPLDPAQPLDADKALVLGGEMRGVKNFIGCIPQNAISANYTLVAADAGKDVFHPATDAVARTWLIPDNSSVPYRVGAVITLSVEHGAGTISLAMAGTDTMRLVPTGTLGTRTLPANSVSTLKKVTATSWQLVTNGGS